jgi:hypothetical protein
MGRFMANQAQEIRSTTSTQDAVEGLLEEGRGVIRLAPTWVPRLFCSPGQRIRLHPDDYYPLGKNRGGIDERWLSSAIRAENGPLTGKDEGLSFAVSNSGVGIPFDEFVDRAGESLLGPNWSTWGKWPMYSKFFDNLAPLPFHIHHRDEQAADVGKPGKPEAYYFAPEMNNHGGTFPYTFFGLHPEVSQDQLQSRLEGFHRGGDNRITELSKAYRLTLGAGWDVPAGILHAPGSLCTYEPQADSDVFAMTESWSNNREVPSELMWKDVPADRVGDVSYIMGLIDWDANVDPNFFGKRFTPRVETSRSIAAGPEWTENWVTYKSDRFSAKEMRIAPGRSVVMTDSAPYGCIILSGHGKFGNHEAATATLVRFGQLTSDEFFVSHEAATTGVRVQNLSEHEEMVILKHFGPRNPELMQDSVLFLQH